MPSSTPNDALLPPRSRLLYIGPMKTGTTAIQAAARDQRQTLLDHGVRYPGAKLNHRSGLGALLGWATMTGGRTGPLGPDRLDTDDGGIPDRVEWDDLKAEIEADTDRRILVTHEFVSQADDAACRRILDELGPGGTHVAITLRSPASILPSLWAQGLKDDAQTEPLNDWLTRIYDTATDRPMPARFRRAYDQAELVRRWAQLVGPDKVTVIVVDRSRPTALSDTFESLLGLPPGMLARGTDTNRSFTAIEASVVQRLNRALADHDVGWDTFNEFVWRGVANRGLLARTTVGDELRVGLPAWAAEAAVKDGKRFADQIRDSGVRIVGDLGQLSAAPPPADPVDSDTIPADIAVRALTGVILAGANTQRRAAKRSAQRDAKIKRLDDVTAKLDKTNQLLEAERAKSKRFEADLARVKQELSDEKTPTLYHRVRKLPPRERPDQTASAYTTRELLAALKRRIKHKLRTGRSKPLEPLPLRSK
ncbi:MAG TPA: hypothetical protein VFM62_04020 [Arthrobacter sp.]|nr:hypothetical protein [Arthrobacter sp.]